MPDVLRIEGADRVARALSRLGAKDAKRIVRSGLRRGGTVIKKAEVGEAPNRTGTLRKSIAVTAAKRKVKGGLGVVVWPNPRKFAGKKFYAPFVIAGHRTRGGKSKVPPDDFVARAFARQREAAVAAAVEKIKTGIAAAFKAGLQYR